MRVSEQWLRQWVDPAVDTDSLAEQLTMAGLEVDKLEPVADFSGVVVGKVTRVENHPQAERLRVATVDVGEPKPLSIVCGAPNVSAGMHAPLARDGAVLQGQAISSTKLRGVVSEGMLCSAKELGLGDDGAGLMTLDEDSHPGQDLRAYLALNDTVIEIDLTPNRGDCNGMAGIAREVGVINRCALTPVAVEPVAGESAATFAVSLSNPAACPRFVGRVIEGVDAGAASPRWMVERLRRAGIRSLGPIVDVTNYVMLELNHPMHAFDLDKLQGGIDVRLAKPGDTLQLLNGQQVEPATDTLLITDASGPLALAGIMGGATTEVSEITLNVFLECAFFAPEHIAGRARRYGLHTDASHRFERGVDPEGQMRAVERATRLLLDMAGGVPGPLVDTAVAEHLPQRRAIELRPSRLRLLLGMAVEPDVVGDILTRLQMQVETVDDGWRVTPPSFRFDIEMEADLIEEIGRIQGYHRLPDVNPASHLTITPIAEAEVGLSRVRQALTQRGYHESICYSFVDADLQRSLDPNNEPIPLANPISADMAVMRTSLWPGLLKALSHNQKRQQERVRLFETGLVFSGGLDALNQESYVGGVVCGGADPEQWASRARAVDFYDAKGDVEALLRLTAADGDFSFSGAAHPALHPGQCARIERGGELCGWLGALHPRIGRELDIDLPVYLFELPLAAVVGGAVPRFQVLSKFPASRRDISIVVADDVVASAVESSIRELAGALLQGLALFDVYRGEGVGQSRKSLTFGLILQDFSRNLTEEEVTGVVTGVLSGLKERYGAELRA